jgi:hypothetical protein
MVSYDRTGGVIPPGLFKLSPAVEGVVNFISFSTFLQKKDQKAYNIKR